VLTIIESQTMQAMPQNVLRDRRGEYVSIGFRWTLN